MTKARALKLIKGYGVADLIDGLKALGFTPLDHPTLVEDMQTAFNKARGAKPTEQMDNKITCRFFFGPDGSVTAKIDPED